MCLASEYDARCMAAVSHGRGAYRDVGVGPRRVVFAQVRECRRARRHEGPVLSIGGAFRDPASQRLDFAGVESLLVGVRRRHRLLRIVGRDALDDSARRGIAWPNGRLALPAAIGTVRAIGTIESQLRLPLLSVGTMTGKAAFREQRLHVTVEADGRRRRVVLESRSGCE